MSPAAASSGQAPPLDPPKRGGGANVLGADAFAARLAVELGFAVEALSPRARLREDLGFDSLQMLELALLLDGMGAHLEAEDLARTARIGDLYRLYVERRTLFHYSALACEGGPPAWPSDAGAPPAPGAAPLRSRRTQQRPVVAADYAYLCDLARGDGDVVLRGPRDRAVSPEQFATVLWQGVLVQHVILDVTTAAPVGLVSAYDADPSNGFAHVGLVLERRVRGRGWPLEAALLFVNYLFRTWPLRKLYAHVRPASVAALASGLGKLFVEEGRLVAHEYVDGAWADVHVLALFRERFEADAAQLLAKVLGAPAAGPQASARASS